MLNRLGKIKQRILTNYVYSRKLFSSQNINEPPVVYSKKLRWIHFIQAFSFTSISISGYVASRIDPKTATKSEMQKKKDLMHLHKSFGLLMFGLIVPRIWIRLSSVVPAHLPATTIELIASKISHSALYGMIIIMPLSGVGMGYYSGWGVPFFKWHMPGANKAKADTEAYKQRTGLFYQTHKKLGKVLEYLIPLHTGAVVFNYVTRGQNLLKRMNPFKN